MSKMSEIIIHDHYDGPAHCKEAAIAHAKNCRPTSKRRKER